MSAPFCILLDGTTGSGKTTVAKILSATFARTANIGMDKIKWFLSDFERGEKDNSIAHAIVFVMAKEYLRNGISLIIDQTFQEGEVEKYEKLAAEHNVPVYKFQLHAAPNIALERVLSRQKDWENKVPKERIKNNIERFHTSQDNSVIVIDTTNQSPEEIADKIRQYIL